MFNILNVIINPVLKKLISINTIYILSQIYIFYKIKTVITFLDIGTINYTFIN